MEHTLFFEIHKINVQMRLRVYIHNFTIRSLDKKKLKKDEETN